MGSRATLRRRLAASMAALAIAVLAAAGATVYIGARHALIRDLDDALVAMANAEIASSMDAPGGAIHIHEQPSELSLAAGSGYEKFAEILDGEGRIRAQTSNLAREPRLVTDYDRLARAIAGSPSFGEARRDGESYRAVYYPLRSAAGENLAAVVAVPRKPLASSLELLFVSLALAVVGGGAAAALVAGRLAGRLVRPLEQIATAARSVVGRDPGERIPEVSGDAEVHDLVTILNEMLVRLEAALAAQRRFVADASHELRTPLSNLRGTIEVALRRPRSAEEYREVLERSIGEVDRLSRLVAQLLMLSRADAGRLALQVAPCDLAQIAHQAAEAFDARARDRGVDIRVEAPQTVEIRGDADRLREVVDNLVENALRSAPPRSTIRITASRVDDGASLTVSDAGPGIAPQHLAQIFDRFYRAEPSRNRSSGGAGLGLAIGKAIVDAHEGRLTVESRLGEGATFRVWLPATCHESHRRSPPEVEAALTQASIAR